MLSIIMVAISVSMDTFSLSLCLGTLDIKYSKMLLFSSIVAIFHFFMPLFGIFIGDLTLELITINTKYIIFLIFFNLGLFMLFDKDDTRSNSLMTFLTLLTLGFIVSIDSFVSGVGINFISNRHLLCCVMFATFSFIFTFLGLTISKKVSKKVGMRAKTAGALMLIALSIQYCQ